MKYHVDELTRLAFVWAEENVKAFADAHEAGSEQRAESLDLLAQLNAYRMKRWGPTVFEDALENTESVDIYELLKRAPNSA